MESFRVGLHEVFAGVGLSECYLDCYIFKRLDNSPLRKCVLICPGGGYFHVSDREAEPVAMAFLARGYNAFILTYSTGDRSGARFPMQLLQGVAAVKYIHENAKAHHTDIENINVCGFSAGGHLAASIGVLSDCDEVNRVFGENRDFSVNRMVLCYPVISSGSYSHEGSFDNLVGTDDDKLREYVSLEKRVTKKTPPTFLWHTSDDTVVDVRNSLEFAAALRAENIPFELHVYPKGMHGLSLANEITANGRESHVVLDCAEWVDLADRFLRKKLF